MLRQDATALVGAVGLAASMLGLLPASAMAEVSMQPLLTGEGSVFRVTGGDDVGTSPVWHGNLRVADRRLGPGTVFTREAVRSPYWRPIWKRDGQRSSAESSAHGLRRRPTADRPR